jgi:hypothetical protein
MLACRQLSSSLAMHDNQKMTRIGKITARTGDSQAVPPERPNAVSPSRCVCSAGLGWLSSGVTPDQLSRLP